MMPSRRVTAAVVVPLLCVLIIATPAAAQLFRAESVAVYDSTGKTVGTPSDGGVIQAEVAFRIGASRILFVKASRSRLIGTSTLAFAGEDCQGPPFIFRAHGNQPASYVHGQRRTVYVPQGAFSRQFMRSSYRFGDSE